MLTLTLDTLLKCIAVQMYKCYKQCSKIGALAMVHAENGDLIAEVSL